MPIEFTDEGLRVSLFVAAGSGVSRPRAGGAAFFNNFAIIRELTAFAGALAFLHQLLTGNRKRCRA
jgi:hypothetical protein